MFLFVCSTPQFSSSVPKQDWNPYEAIRNVLVGIPEEKWLELDLVPPPIPDLMNLVDIPLRDSSPIELHMQRVEMWQQISCQLATWMAIAKECLALPGKSWKWPEELRKPPLYINRPDWKISDQEDILDWANGTAFSEEERNLLQNSTKHQVRCLSIHVAKNKGREEGHKVKRELEQFLDCESSSDDQEQKPKKM